MKQEHSPATAGPVRARGAGFMGRLRGYMIAGVLVTLPIWVTAYFAWMVLDYVDSTITPLIPERYNPNSYLPFAVPGLGLIVLLWGLVVIGWLAASLFGRFLVRLGEGIVARMPFVRGVYGSTKQIVESVLAQKAAFREVVLIEFPRTDCWSLGFVTGKTEGEIQELTGAAGSSISQQLAVLRSRGIVVPERAGTTVRYHAADPQIYVLLDAAREIFYGHLSDSAELLRLVEAEQVATGG